MILSGKDIAEQMYTRFREQTDTMPTKPKLVVILVGEDPASTVYVRNKEISCEKAGILSQTIKMPSDIPEKEVLEVIEKLNSDTSVTGMIVQVPLPKHISEEKVLYAIHPKKDMDGFHPANIGEMYLGKNKELLPPATPAGIIKMLEASDIQIEGKNIVVIGRSNNVGKAVAIMLLNRNATVTICHSRTQNLKEHTKKADLIIAAVGIPKFVTSDMIKDDVVIIDVGIHPTENGLCGDVDFEYVEPKTKAISPVPGGVGPMTVASLIENTLKAHIRNQ